MENVISIHNNYHNKNYFTIAIKNFYWEQYYFNSVNEIDIDLTQKDIYISQNTFSEKSRKSIYLKELRTLYIDIDCYKKNLTKEAVKYFLENDLYGKIPIPNRLIDSGRGLYYIIYLNDTPAEDIDKWLLIENYLYEQLEYLGADSSCIDVSRVLRVVGSLNSKSNTRVKVVDKYEYSYTLDEIIENYIPDDFIDKHNKNKQNKKEPTKSSETKGVRRKKHSSNENCITLFTSYNLYYNRIEDIKTLVNIRNGDMKGYREVTLFLYRHFLNIFCNSDEEAIEKTLELNDLFTEPLPVDELIRDTKSGVFEKTGKKYYYSNDKLIYMLNITEAEQMQLYTIISKEEKQRRNNIQRYNKKRDKQGLTKKELEKQKLIESIIELRRKKYTIKIISELLNKSEKTIRRYVKEIEEKSR